MKKLLILGAGIIQVPIIRKAKDKGYYTVVADYDENAPGFKYADKVSTVSTIDKDAVLNLAILENVDGILTTSDYPVNVVAYVGSKLNLPTMSQEVADVCTNKYIQRSLFLKNGIKTPYFKLCDASQDLSVFNEFPYIVKPCDSSASRGVKKVVNKAELEEALKDAMKYSRSSQVLIESFIEGREFSVETLTQNNVTHVINITEKITKGEDLGYFVEDVHLEPARLSDEERNLIVNEVLSATKLIGFDNCPSHTEVKLNEKGAFIIEIACRLGGDYITSDLVPLSTGVDMLDNLIRIAMGEPIDVEKKINKVSFIQFLNQDNYYDCVKFIEEQKDTIHSYEIEDKHDRLIKSSLDRMGYIIMQVDDYAEFDKIMDKIHK